MKNLILPFSLGLALAASASAQVSINEIRIDQPGSDVDEYFEIAGPAGTSLDGLTYVVLGDSGSTNIGGEIEAAVDLTGQTIGTSGLFLVAKASLTLGTADLVTTFSFENGDNVTHMLVDGFTGAVSDDVDTDDDGIIDVVLWTSVVDSVGLVETVGTGDLLYSPNLVGPSGTFVPSHVSIIGGAWVMQSYGTSYDDTPGRPNIAEVGASFCDPAAVNSTGSDVVLTGFMDNGIGSGLHIEANGGPDQEVGYFLVGTGASDPGLSISNGFLCLSGAFYRYNVNGTSANSIGMFDVNGQLQNLPGTSTSGTGYDVPAMIPDTVPIPIMAGDTYHFQLWYRDTPAGVGTSNFSTGLTVTF